MKKYTKRILESLLPEQALKYRAFHSLIQNKESYLYTSGWMQSLEEGKPMDRDGRPMPWMNFPIVKFLEEKLNSDLVIFEYGSGYSTLFYARRVKSVVSVEYDQGWLSKMRALVPDNVELVFREEDIDGEYCRAISSREDKYDVVIVDGRDRVNCVIQSMPCLSERGVILLDDSQREKYQKAISMALSSGFKTLNLEGLKPIGAGIDRTTILYREGNCFGI